MCRGVPSWREGRGREVMAGNVSLGLLTRYVVGRSLGWENVEVSYRSRLSRWTRIVLVFVEVKRHHFVTHPEIRHSSRDKMYQNVDFTGG